MKKQFKMFASGALAIMLASVNCITVGAAGKNTVKASDIVKAIHAYDLEVDKYLREKRDMPNSDKRMPVVDTSSLPSKFDLRDVNGKNYVSPVKDQTPWGSCWSFGATAAAETSIAYDRGHDYNAETGSEKDALFDLSEKHLAWFSYTAVPEDSGVYSSQAGEGFYFDFKNEVGPDKITDKIYNFGGYLNYATAVYSSGMGPTLESILPYKETTDTVYREAALILYEIDENGDITASFKTFDMTDTALDDLRKEWTEKGYENISVEEATGKYIDYFSGKEKIENYTGGAKKQFAVYTIQNKGDWTVDEAFRFLSFYDLKDGNMLPSPSLTDKNKAYIFNQTGVDAIKSEIVRGRGVSLTFAADQSRPGQVKDPNEETYLNFIDKDGNVTDDPFAEYWAHYTYDKEYDPSDKNSINKAQDSNHAVCVIGYDDNFPKEYFKDPNGTIGGDGAFLVKNSWGTKEYDGDQLTFTWGNGGDGCFWLSYYDQSISYPESFDFETDEDLVMRNVDMYDFLPSIEQTVVSFDSDLYMANVFTAQNNCTVRYIGLESAAANIDVEYSVYMLDSDAESPIDGLCIATDSEHFNYAGYHAVDIGKTFYIPKDMKYSIVVKATEDNKSDLYFSETFNTGEYPSDTPKDESVDIYAKAVVNPGESFVGTSLTDSGSWTDWSDIIAKLRKLNKKMNNDNVEYDNFPIRSYPQTELFTILHFSDVDEGSTLTPGEKIRGTVYIENNSGIDFFKEDNLELNVTIGQSKTNYPIGKIKDLKAGEIKEFNYTYTVKEKDAAAGEVVSTVKVTWDGEELDYGALFDETLTFRIDVDYAPDSNPATGNELYSAVILAGVAAMIAAAARKRR